MAAPTTTLTRTAYNPTLKAPNSASLFSIIHRATRGDGTGPDYAIVRLTNTGNLALRELCHTADQRQVWTFPSYEFFIRRRRNGTLMIRADQVYSTFF